VLAPPIDAADEPAGALESFEDSGEAAEVAAAAAAGQFVNVVLYAPGRLLYVRPVDESVEEEKQRFELVDGKGGGWVDASASSQSRQAVTAFVLFVGAACC
jgi:hypothetical protein